MRILLGHNYYQQRGGEDIYFESLTKLLKAKGHDVFTYIRRSDEIQTIKDKIQTATNLFVNKKTEQDIKAIIHNFKPDIAHFNNIFPLITPTAYNVCKKHHIPVVQTLQTYRLMCPKGFVFRDNKICELCVNKLFAFPAVKYACYHGSHLASLSLSASLTIHKLKNTFDLVDRYICPADFVKEYHLKYLSLPEKKFVVIPHYTDIPPVEDDQPISDYFLFVGRLSEEKGILRLVEEISQLTNIKLLVMGDGPLRKAILKYSNKNIKTYPFSSHKDIAKRMKHAIATIIPSPWYEIGPLVLMESFANGTPVIVPKLGVFKERVQEYKTGFFFEATDFSSIQNVIRYILENKKDLSDMKTYIKKEYVTKYSPDVYYDTLLKTYQRLISSRISSVLPPQEE